MVRVLMTLLLITPVQAQVVIGSKNFSESMLLAEMVALMLEENYDTKVTRKIGLGGTKVVFDALNQGDIDVYPEYTGTGYVMILKQQGLTDPKKVHTHVQKEFSGNYAMVWSNPIGFNNTYALAVRAEDERFRKISKLSQLAGKVESFLFAAPYEFMERKDGYPGFTKLYRLNFEPDKVKSLEAGLMYSAVKSGKVDMIMSYSTDGRLKAYNLKIIEDDLGYFPPYEVALLSTERSFKKYPVLAEIFIDLEQAITEGEMIALNDQVDRLKRDVSDVARNFLIQKNIIEGKQTAIKAKSFWEYAFGKRKYLWKLFIEHIFLSIGALFLAMLVSLPTGILLTRYERLSRFVFPTINTIQTIPSIALLGFMIPLLGIGYLPALIALFLYSLLPLIRNTYAGIKGVDENFIEASRGMGLSPTQILFHVEIPLALPVILAGLRTATVIVIGTATLAALVGAGGFGDPIFKGVATVNSRLILLGAVPAALLAIVIDKFLGLSEQFLVSKGLRLKR